MFFFTGPSKIKSNSPPQSGAMKICFSLCLLTPSCFKQCLGFLEFPLPQQSSCAFSRSDHALDLFVWSPQNGSLQGKEQAERAPGAFFSGYCQPCLLRLQCVCREVLEAADKWDLLQQCLWLGTLGPLNSADNKNYVSWGCVGRRYGQDLPPEAC